MSLQVWLPLTHDLCQQGLSTGSITSNNASFDTNGKLGGCYVFSGVDNAIGVGNLFTMTSTDFTFTCWFYHDDTWSSKSWETIFGGPSGFELQAKNSTTNSPVIYLYSWGKGNFTYELNKWNHLAMVRTASDTKVYLNGELKITGSAGSIPNGSYFVGSWRDATSQNFKGKMCDVRIYDNALSASEVKEIAKGLVLHYPLNRHGWGQENLLTDTNFTADFISSMAVNNGINLGQWKNESANVSLTMDGDYVKLHYATNTSRYGIHYEIALEPGTYTYSITAGGRMTCSFGLATGWPSTNIITTNVAGRFSQTFTVSEAANYRMYIYTTSTNPDIWFNWPKLEVGDKTTPWCPNSEDDLGIQLQLNRSTSRQITDVEWDCSGFGHHALINSGAIPETPKSPLQYTTDTPNKYNISAHFTSTETKIHISNFPTSGFANSYSFAWWGKRSSNNPMFWGFSDGIRLNGMYAGTLWNTGDSSNNPIYKPGTTTTITAPTVNTWHHYVMTGDGTTCKLYLDGELYGQAKTYKAISGTSIYINGWTSDTIYSSSDMYMSDFRIYATALSADDVKSLYQNEAAFDDQGNILGPIR